MLNKTALMTFRLKRLFRVCATSNSRTAKSHSFSNGSLLLEHACR